MTKHTNAHFIFCRECNFFFLQNLHFYSLQEDLFFLSDRQGALQSLKMGLKVPIFRTIERICTVFFNRLKFSTGLTCVQNVVSFGVWEGGQNGARICLVVNFECTATLQGHKMKTKASIKKLLVIFDNEGLVCLRVPEPCVLKISHFWFIWCKRSAFMKIGYCIISY